MSETSVQRFRRGLEQLASTLGARVIIDEFQGSDKCADLKCTVFLQFDFVVDNFPVEINMESADKFYGAVETIRQTIKPRVKVNDFDFDGTERETE